MIIYRMYLQEIYSYTADNGIYTIQGSDQPVKVTAVDVDGNRVEVTIQVNPQHTWKTGGVEAPTCTETGSANAVCEVCGEHGQTELLPLGHDFSQDWTIDVEPTGKTAGEKSHHCSRCDGRRDVMKIPATGVGTVKVMLVTGEGVPEMSVANSQESLIKNVLTQKETDMLAQGYDIYLTVTVSPKEDVSELQQAQTAGWITTENGGLWVYVFNASRPVMTVKNPVTTVAKLKAGRPDAEWLRGRAAFWRRSGPFVRRVVAQTRPERLCWFHDTAVTPDNPSDNRGIRHRIIQRTHWAIHCQIIREMTTEIVTSAIQKIKEQRLSKPVTAPLLHGCLPYWH
ncbi:MAG: hypothetical protein V8S35_08690 [Lachnospira sp.]